MNWLVGKRKDRPRIGKLPELYHPLDDDGAEIPDEEYAHPETSFACAEERRVFKLTQCRLWTPESSNVLDCLSVKGKTENSVILQLVDSRCFILYRWSAKLCAWKLD